MSTIEEVYRELNYPSKRKLALALHARRIPFTGEQLEELTRTSVTRQIFAPLPKYDGHHERSYEREVASRPGKHDF